MDYVCQAQSHDCVCGSSDAIGLTEADSAWPLFLRFCRRFLVRVVFEEYRTSEWTLRGEWRFPLSSMVGDLLKESKPTPPAFKMPANHAFAYISTLSACDRLSRLHAAKPDRSLRFEHDGHKYFFNDKIICRSAL